MPLSTGHHRILVVDDHRDGADSLGQVLRMMGADVRVAYDGSGALAEVAAFAPTTILLDLSLGAEDGVEVALRIRRQCGDEPPRLVALTGWNRPEDRQRAAAGFDAYLLKPVELDALLSAVQ